MTKYIALDPDQARKIEEAAVKKFTPSVPEKKVSTKPEPIFTVKAIFPFQFFPDELQVFPDKVTLITRLGPGMEKIRQMHLHEIAELEADCGPVFGHLHIIPKLRTEEPMLIDRLSRKKALEARDFIENLLDNPPEIKESTF